VGGGGPWGGAGNSRSTSAHAAPLPCFGRRVVRCRYKTVGSDPAYWQHGDMESALQAHPTLQPGLTRTGTSSHSGSLPLANGH